MSRIFVIIKVIYMNYVRRIEGQNKRDRHEQVVCFKCLGTRMIM